MGKLLLYLVIEGNPVPKARPRVTRWGTYTPAKTRNFEDKIRAMAKSAWGDREPYEGPLEVSMSFFFPMPKSWSKKKREKMMRQPCAKHVDLDNLEKCCCDGINKSGFWKDDCQVCTVHAMKKWGLDGRTYVEIREMKCG